MVSVWKCRSGPPARYSTSALLTMLIQRLDIGVLVPLDDDVIAVVVLVGHHVAHDLLGQIGQPGPVGDGQPLCRRVPAGRTRAGAVDPPSPGRGPWSSAATCRWCGPKGAIVCKGSPRAHWRSTGHIDRKPLSSPMASMRSSSSINSATPLGGSPPGSAYIASQAFSASSTVPNAAGITAKSMLHPTE